ncbi:MAG: GNAT family N-acetyltransferase [Xanthomonadales bacterium]|jgi:D-alanyl-D-alanine carboxypeptidase|nr:GNAT family N-acetyltransferase [Xanthomonadales bacterium]
MAIPPPNPKPKPRASRPILVERDDADALAGLWRHAMSSWAGGSFSRAQLNRSVELAADGALRSALQNRCVLGVRHRREWVGLALIDLEQAELHGPFVAPDWQGQGLGRRLVTAAERRSADFQLLRLAVSAFVPSLPFFEACGYEPLPGTREELQAGAGLPVMTLRRRFPRRQGRFGRRVASLCRELGLPADYGRRRALPLQPEASRLVPAGTDCFDRPQQMTAETRNAWDRMQAAASADGVTLQLVSAFRSVDYQAGLIRRKLDAGQGVGDILAVSAAPGFSEHHTGRALDLTTPGAAALEPAFEETAAYRWLTQHAGAHGFRQSYPAGNHHGIAFEPWHWYHAGL